MTLSTEPRRAAVAIIMRVAPSPTSQTASSSSIPPPPVTLNEFFAQDWVNEDGVSVEVLFLRRDSPQSERDVAQNMPRNAEDAHVAFPGGRMETGDEGGLYTGSSVKHHSKRQILYTAMFSYATNMGGDRR